MIKDSINCLAVLVCWLNICKMNTWFYTLLILSELLWKLGIYRIITRKKDICPYPDHLFVKENRRAIRSLDDKKGNFTTLNFSWNIWSGCVHPIPMATHIRIRLNFLGCKYNNYKVPGSCYGITMIKKKQLNLHIMEIPVSEIPVFVLKQSPLFQMLVKCLQIFMSLLPRQIMFHHNAVVVIWHLSVILIFRCSRIADSL